MALIQSHHTVSIGCMDCLEHMIKATKDDQTEASDGNVFRVFLHCPNCRSNLGPSIRDTVLLRKVDKYSTFKHVKNGSNGKLEGIDEKLSASELRFKHALEKDADVAAAVEGAQSREDEFFGRGVEVDTKAFQYLSKLSTGSANTTGSSSQKGSVWSFDDEEGVEADLSGPHKSFIFRHHSQMKINVEGKVEGPKMVMVEADSTLLCGLDAFMTDQEQQFVTAQLISGSTAKLAVATEMLHYISALSREGLRPSLKRRRSSLMVKNPSMTRSMLASIKEVIREGNEARRKEDERSVGVVATHLTAAAQGVAGGRRVQKRLVDLEMKKRMEYMKLNPLPLRMPKYAEATASKNVTCMKFVDDMWDGTVLDAFSKITVNRGLLGGKVTVTKQHAESHGISRVIDAGSPKSSRSRGKGYIDTERSRVIVASVSSEIGMQGVVKGDVVTHFNGEEFEGDAQELTELLSDRYEGEVLTFVFNADAAVAEALRRRSLISDQ